MSLAMCMALAAGCGDDTTDTTAKAPRATEPSQGATSATPTPEPAVAPLTWRECEPGRPRLVGEAARRKKDFQCATLVVPLDYDDPDGRRLEIAVGRMKAGGPGRRAGTIIVSPESPGSSGVELAANARSALPGTIGTRFDVVGFDPRGVANSAPIRCSRDKARVEQAPSSTDYPVTDADVAARKRAEVGLAEDCEKFAGPILDHLSTANVARDMDRLRAALGEESVNHIGFSHGTLLGATYANLFPDRIRTMTMDGAVNPVEWMTGTGDDESTADTPTFIRLDAVAGAQQTLAEFFRLCDRAGKGCALAPDSKRRYGALLRKAGEPEGLVIEKSGARTSETERLDRPGLVGRTLAELSSASGWRSFARRLARAEGALPRPPSSSAASAPTAPDVARWAAVCGESDNPARWYDVATVAREAERSAMAGRGSPFAPAQAWSTSMCTVWPGRDKDRYVGPWDAATANPVLVVNNRFDPATPLSDAAEMNGLLANSVLLTVNDWGHRALGRNTCASRVVLDYLVTGRPPAADTQCPTDGNPFRRPQPRKSG
ncbi:MAG: alpha/beta hydrolase [Nocardioides sp.]